VLRLHGCSLAQEATRAPVDFAWVASFLLDHGRVVHDRELWGFLESDHVLSLSDEYPRVTGNCLHYMCCAKFDIAPSKRLLERVTINLETAGVVFDPVALRRR
jgi:hypothetical protein